MLSLRRDPITLLVIRNLPVAVVVGDGKGSERGGRGLCGANAPFLPSSSSSSPRKIVEEKNFLQWQSQRESRPERARGDDREGRRGRCLVMSDASPCVCDNNLASAVAAEGVGGASETTAAASYMC